MQLVKNNRRLKVIETDFTFKVELFNKYGKFGEAEYPLSNLNKFISNQLENGYKIRLERGDKVTYKGEIGIVKTLHISMPEFAFVVFKCNEDWANYKNYTSNRVRIADLEIGWTCEQENKLA